VTVVRILRLGVVLGLLVASACGTSDKSSSTVDTTPAPAVTSTDAATTEPTATQPAATPAETGSATNTASSTTAPTLVDVKLYFLRGEQLAVVHRDVVGPAVLDGALNELLAGPTTDEVTANLGSEVPADTELLGVNLADDLVTVDLDAQFESGGGSLSMTARIAQIVFTATQFDNTDQVLFLMEGAPIEFLGGEGIVLTDPQTRSMVDRFFIGGVIIDRPAPGETVSNPFTVVGEGDVFEGDFAIEVWANGEQIGGVAPVTAGAWGDWADFETTITLDAPAGPIELIAYDEGGCGDEPDCPPIIRTVVPLTFAG
jgi:spore germination protein GerM